MSTPTPPLPNQRQTSTMAVVSLISGILSWIFLPFIGSIVAIITGHMARAEIRREAGRLEGDGLAVGGLVLGYLQLFLGIAFLVIVFVFLGGLAFFASQPGTFG